MFIHAKISLETVAKLGGEAANVVVYLPPNKSDNVSFCIWMVPGTYQE